MPSLQIALCKNSLKLNVLFCESPKNQPWIYNSLKNHIYEEDNRLSNLASAKEKKNQ